MKLKKCLKKKKKIKKPNEIVNIVEEILEFNRKKQSGWIKNFNTRPSA